MAVERIDRATDPRVDPYRSLRDGELLRTRGVFVAEGRLVVRRVLADERFGVESLLVNEAALRDLASRFPGSTPLCRCACVRAARFSPSPASICTAAVSLSCAGRRRSRPTR